MYLSSIVTNHSNSIHLVIVTLAFGRGFLQPKNRTITILNIEQERSLN